MEDSHFYNCWITLKAMKPRQAKLMDQIEREVFGIKVTQKPRKKEKKDADNKQKPEIV